MRYTTTPEENDRGRLDYLEGLVARLREPLVLLRNAVRLNHGDPPQVPRDMTNTWHARIDCTTGRTFMSLVDEVEDAAGYRGRAGRDE